MKINEVSSPEAVVRALEEFDSLGRKEYLTRYGFKPARRWYVEHDGLAMRQELDTRRATGNGESAGTEQPNFGYVIRSTKRVLNIFEIRSQSLIGERAVTQSMLSNSRVLRLGG